MLGKREKSLIDRKEVRVIRGKTKSVKHFDDLIKHNTTCRKMNMINIVEHANYVEKVHTPTELLILYEDLHVEKNKSEQEHISTSISIAGLALLIAICIPFFLESTKQDIFKMGLLVLKLVSIFGGFIIMFSLSTYLRIRKTKKCNYFISLINLINKQNN